MGSNTKAGVPGGSRLELAGGWRGGDDAGGQGWRAGQRMGLGRRQGLETLRLSESEGQGESERGSGGDGGE